MRESIDVHNAYPWQLRACHKYAHYLHIGNIINIKLDLAFIAKAPAIGQGGRCLLSAEECGRGEGRERGEGGEEGEGGGG